MEPCAIEGAGESGACLCDHAHVHEASVEPVHWVEANRAAVALSNLVYNLVRFEQIERLGLKNWRVA